RWVDEDLAVKETLDIPGFKGSITWHHYTAADVVGFTLTRTRHGHWSVKATIVNDNAFKMAQRPRVFRVPTIRGEWRWPITSDASSANHVWQAELGPMEFSRKESVPYAPLPV